MRLTLEIVKVRFGSDICVLATDVAGFRVRFPASKFVAKPLSRAEWRSKTGPRKLVWLIAQVLTIGGLFALLMLPMRADRFRRVARWWSSFTRSPWIAEIIAADRVVGVGGGYLGDNYLRESLLSLMQFRLALRTGSLVETMPISITSVERRLLRWSLSRWGRGVRWRARESLTVTILESVGLRVELVPDLAWLNAREPLQSTRRAGLVVAPLGSHFYSTDSSGLPASWPAVRQAIEQLGLGDQVQLVPMHRWDPLMRDGKDDDACKLLDFEIRKIRPDLLVTIQSPGTYSEVRSIMGGAKLAICERLHAALAALTSGTTAIVIGYEPKHAGVLELAGLGGLIRAAENVESGHAVRAAAEFQASLVGRSLEV